MTPVEIVEVTVSPVYPRNDKHFPSERILQIMFMMMLPTAKRIVIQNQLSLQSIKAGVETCQ